MRKERICFLSYCTQKLTFLFMKLSGARGIGTVRILGIVPASPGTALDPTRIRAIVVDAAAGTRRAAGALL